MRKSTKNLSSLQEKNIAKIVEGDLIPASGGLQVDSSWKGDINTVDEKFECKITERPSYTLKFEDLLTLRGNAAKDLREPIFIFEFKDKGKYVVTFCGQKEKETAFIHFDTTDKSYLLKETDLRNMGLKCKGPAVGIKFKDKEANTSRYIIIQDFSKWQDNRDFNRVQGLMKEFAK